MEEHSTDNRATEDRNLYRLPINRRMIDYKKFCIYPFNQIVVRAHGRLSPCCHKIGNENLSQMTPEEYWSGTTMSNLRQQMLSGNDVAECQWCYDNENATGHSMRMDSLRMFDITENTNIQQRIKEWEGATFPEMLELHVGNLCNLKCLTCVADDSSAVHAENDYLGYKMGIISEFPKLVSAKQDFNNVLINLNNGKIKHLDLRGGESLLVPEVRELLGSLDDSVYQNVILRLQTNTTHLSDEWKKIISRFRRIKVSSSIDAIGEQLTYIRYPAKWREIQNNLNWYLQQPNIKTTVTITVSNLNLLCVDQLLKWLLDRGINFNLNPVATPVIFQTANMPSELLDLTKQRLEPLIHMLYSHDKINFDVLQKLINIKPLNDKKLWKEFCMYINLRDAHRDNRIFNAMPEFEKFWHGQ